MPVECVRRLAVARQRLSWNVLGEFRGDRAGALGDVGDGTRRPVVFGH
jgi:hypothetical protein